MYRELCGVYNVKNVLANITKHTVRILVRC